MPPVKVRFHPDADKEAETSRQWYAGHSEAAAKSFLAELELAVERIRESPQRWPRYGKKGTRRYILPRFPFSVIYRMKEEWIEVLAVAHHKRKPGYWKSR